MPNGWPYAVGTLLYWVGVVSTLNLAYRLIQLLKPPTGTDPANIRKAAGISMLVAGLSLVVSSPLLKGHEGGKFFLPVVWFIMPFAAWVAVVCAVLAIIPLFKVPITPVAARWPLLKQASGYCAAFILALYFYRIDPSNSIGLLKGAIPLTLSTTLGLVALALATLFAMAFAATFAKNHGLIKGVATHIALLAGSVVFGVPFLWLVITSFKEDVDMASPNGLVWIPKVQETIPYFSKTDPLLQRDYQGQTVVTQIQSRNPDGTIVANIIEPAAIAGHSFVAPLSSFKQIAKQAGLVWSTYNGAKVKAFVANENPDGSERLQILEPANLKGVEFTSLPADAVAIRHVGLKWQNYPEALEYLPPAANRGLTYLGNTLYLVFFSVIGTLLSSSLVAYAFSRMRFPGREFLFKLMLSTMMLPAAVTMLPQFLIFRSFGWIDTLRPLWVPAFLGSAFNIFLLRQFLLGIPMELEDAAKIDGCTYLKTYWSVMLPQIKPALAVIGIWTFMGAWNNFMGPLIYVSSPEHMPISYALQMFNSDRGGEPGMLMALTTLSMLPVLALFFFAQRYFIEGVTLSGLGGR